MAKTKTNSQAKQKIVVIVIIAIMVGFLIGIFFNEPTNTKTSNLKPTIVNINVPDNWNTYVSKEYSFRVAYPPDSILKFSDISYTAGQNKTGAVRFTGPQRFDVKGYEKVGGYFMLQLDFQSNGYLVVQYAFYKNFEPGEQAVNVMNVTKSYFENSPEYRDAKKIITIVESLNPNYKVNGSAYKYTPTL